MVRNNSWNYLGFFPLPNLPDPTTHTPTCPAWECPSLPLLLITSVTSLRFIAAIRGSSGYAVALITSILSLICGLLLLLDPWNGQISMILFAGIMIIVYALTSIVDMFILKKNIKEISNRLKQSFKTINQSEEK